MAAIRGSDAQGLPKSAVLFDVYRAKKGVEAPGLAADEKSLADATDARGCRGDADRRADRRRGAGALAALQQQVGARLR